MNRWLPIPLLLFAVGCSPKLTVMTEHIEVVEPSDFLMETHEIDGTDGVTDSGVAEESLDDLAIGALIIESSSIDIEEPNEHSVLEKVGVAVTVEEMIGHVNGRPIYANEVLEPIADELRAILKQSSPKMSKMDFEEFVRNVLYRETQKWGMTIREGGMYTLVEHYLLLSEASSEMPVEQEVGLIGIMGQMKRDLVSTQGGSQAQSRQTFEESDSSVEEFLERQREGILIDSLLRQKVIPKVSVKWRDIQREFNSIEFVETVDQIDEDEARTTYIVDQLYSGIPLKDILIAHPLVTLGRINLKIDSPDALLAKDAFENGNTFLEVAELVKTKNGGVWDVLKCGVGGMDDIDQVQNLPDIGDFKRALKGAKKGEYLEPFDYGEMRYWLSVIDIVPPISLYNKRIQMAVHEFLWRIERDRERIRFVESLWGEGSIEEVEEMAKRVAKIAAQRYYNQ